MDGEGWIVPQARVGYSCLNMEQPITQRKSEATAKLSVVMPRFKRASSNPSAGG
jgi:hypothetical protein